MSRIDPIARGLAAQARAASLPLATRALGNIGTRIFAGRIANTKAVVTTGTTYEVLLATAAPFDAVRVILSVSQTGSNDAVSPRAIVTGGAVASTADATVSALAPTTFTFASASSVTLAPATSSSRSVFTMSDWIPLPSVARSDGGTLPLLVVRCLLDNVTGNAVIQGNGSDSFANWATHPSGRIWRMLSRAGQYQSSGGWSAMTSANSTVETGCPIVGVQYLSRGKVVNVAGFGDSITEGRGSYIGEGWGFPACVALSSNPAGVAYEWSNLGWSGQTTTFIRERAIAASAAGLGFDAACLPAGSPNDISTTISAAQISAMRGNIGVAMQALIGKGAQPILWTWLPSNTSIKAYGSSDSLRRAYNDEVRGWTGRGTIVVDFDATLAGVDDGTGQIQLKSGTTGDGIHPNDTGNAQASAIMARAVQRAVQPAAGLLVA